MRVKETKRVKETLENNFKNLLDCVLQRIPGGDDYMGKSIQ